MLSFFLKVWDFIRHPTHTRTMGIAIMLVLVSAVSLTVIVAQQQQSTKQRASGEECQLDTASCETERKQCEQQCETLKQNIAKFYTCATHSYNDQNCREQVNAIGAGACGEQDVSTDCNDLGEENGSSKTVCFEDSSCTASNNDNCATSCGQQKSICDNNVIINYNNCVKVTQQNTVLSPTEAPEVPTSTARPAETVDESLQPTLEISTPTPAPQQPTSTLNLISPEPSQATVSTDQSSVQIFTSTSCSLKSKGDANCDGKIDNSESDNSDYEIWLKEFKKLLTTTSSDFNNDGIVNTLDFNILRDNSL